MSRLNDPMIKGAYDRDIDRPILDLAYGGQNGWSPNLTQWTSNQAYVSRPMHCIMLEAPGMFQKLPEPKKWVSSLKSLFELHAYAIEGFNAELKVETDTHDIGGGGEKHHEIVNVTREASTPKFTFIEKYGRPIQTLLDYWIRYGLMDPETKFALLGTVSGANDTPALKDMLADWYTATCLFIVPDPLHKSVDKAWLTTNMFPTSTGQITGKRDLKTGQEMLTLDIEFPGISQYGLGVSRFAQGILDKITITHADPFMRPSHVKGVSGDVEGAATPTGVAIGYGVGLAEVGNTAVTNMSK